MDEKIARRDRHYGANRPARSAAEVVVKTGGEIVDVINMPSWVAPSLAAELWGVREEVVHQRIAEGSAAVRYEGDFCFVNVGTPHEECQPAPAVSRPPVEEPQSWGVIRNQTSRLRRAPRKAA